MARELPAMAGAAERALGRLADEAADDARRRVAVRSGATRRSITGALRGHVDGGAVAVGASAPGAEVLELGGTIRGRPWLAVPMRGVHAAGPRFDGELVAIRDRSGRVFLASRRGGATEVRWRLVRSIELRAQPYLRPAAEAASARLPEAVAGAIRATLEVR